MTKFNIAQMPEGVRWWHIIGVGFVAGIGFTVSIFIAELAFGGKADLVDTSKASIFIASGISAIFGLIILRLTRRHNVTVDS